MAKLIAKSFLSLTSMLPSGFLNIFQVKLDERGHLGWLPIRIFGFPGPREWQMPNLSRFFCLLKNLKSFQQNSPLPFTVSHLPYRSAIRIFNGRRSWNPYGPVKFISGCKNNGRKSSFF
jgi:hypothetical protein